MRKLILSAAVLFATVAVSSAQSIDRNHRGGKSRKNWNTSDSLKKTPEEIAKIQTDRIKYSLKLDDKQGEKIYELALERAKKRQEQLKNRKNQFNEQSSKNREAMSAIREKMKAENTAESQAYENKLQKILTPEQYALYTQRKNEQIKRVQERIKERKDRAKTTGYTNS